MEEEELLYTSEDVRRNERITLIQKDFRMEYSPPEWLAEAESAFKWYISLEWILVVNINIPEKMLDYKNQGADYGFEKLTMLLSYVILHAYEIINNSASSSDDESESSSDNDSSTTETKKTGTITDLKLEEIFSLAKDALNEMAENEGDIMYTRIGPAMSHVLQATEAHLLFLKGNVEKSKEVARSIQPTTEMSVESLAGFEGIKAKFILSAYKDVRVALVALENAMKLDPTFAAWKYLAGKTIRRLRREFKEDMPVEELVYFQEAVDLERNPKYLVFLAQAYQEMALQSLHKRNIPANIPDTIDDMFRKAVDLFRECWSLKNDSAAIVRRVGNGLLKMKGDFVDLTLGKEALLKAVELSPNCVTYHQLGTFYYKHLKDDEKALEYFEKNNGIFAFTDVIRVNLIRDPGYDPRELIEKWAVSAERLSKKDVIFCDVAWYYLFMKRDLDMAVKYFWKVLKVDFKSFRVLEFQSYAFCVYGPLNILKILVNEILLANEKNLAMLPEERTDMTFLLKFKEKVCEKHPNLSELNPNPDLFDNIRISIEKQISFLRKKRYGYSVHHKQNTNFEENRNWRAELNQRSSLQRRDESSNRVFNYYNSSTSNESDMSRRESGSNRFDINNRGSGSNRFDMSNSRSDSNRFDMSNRGNGSNGFDMNNRGSGSNRFDMNNRGSGSNRFDISNRGSGSNRFDMSNSRSDSNRFDMSNRGNGSNRFDMNNSRSDSNWRFSTSGVSGTDRQEGRRQYNNSRYDVNVTDWRSENRN